MKHIVKFLSHNFNKMANPLLIKQNFTSRADTQKITNNLIETAFDLGFDSFYKNGSPKDTKNTVFMKFITNKQSEIVYYNIDKKSLHSAWVKGRKRAYDNDINQRCQWGM